MRILPYTLSEDIAVSRPNADEIITSIGHFTTPDDFDALCAQHPSYELSHGERDLQQTALDQAIFLDNIPLVRHIVKKGGTDLLRLRSFYGRSLVLQSALAHSEQEKCFAMVKELVDLGADVNLTIKFTEGDVMLTPLFKAANMAVWQEGRKDQEKNLEIIKFLLRRGANICYDHPDFVRQVDAKARAIIDKAATSIAHETLAARRAKGCF